MSKNGCVKFLKDSKKVYNDVKSEVNDDISMELIENNNNLIKTQNNIIINKKEILKKQSTNKRALLVGINYTGTPHELRGCINDVEHIKLELIRKGYKKENIVILTDNTKKKPTRENIIKELLCLILSKQTSLFFHYSGHGSYEWDLDGDENDGKDECLIPLDYDKNGVIVDDELRGLLCCLRYNQSLFCLLDCCHSGTGMDLRYNLFQRYGTDYFTLLRDKKRVNTRGDCVMISGCLDHQTSADAYIDNKFQGAMTSSFIKSTNNNNVKSYLDLIKSMREYLEKNKYTQVPTLSSGKRIRLSSEYKF